MGKKVMFKSDKKKALIEEIRLCRERGGTFPEIAALFNLRGKLTLNGREWTPNYIYRFYTENIAKKNDGKPLD